MQTATQAQKPPTKGGQVIGNNLTIRSIWTRTEFVGFHAWPEAPEEVIYLRNQHRHLFGVKVYADVKPGEGLSTHSLQHLLRKIIGQLSEDERVLTWSCEDWAAAILSSCNRFTLVEVDEDGENGARIER